MERGGKEKGSFANREAGNRAIEAAPKDTLEKGKCCIITTPTMVRDRIVVLKSLILWKKLENSWTTRCYNLRRVCFKQRSRKRHPQRALDCTPAFTGISVWFLHRR